MGEAVAVSDEPVVEVSGVECQSANANVGGTSGP